MIGFQWKQAPQQVFPQNYTKWVLKKNAMLGVMMVAMSKAVEAWMKANAPWEDKTGNARASLFASVFTTPISITIILGHGVEYGMQLETRDGGSFQVVAPAIDLFGQATMVETKRLFG